MIDAYSDCALCAELADPGRIASPKKWFVPNLNDIGIERITTFIPDVSEMPTVMFETNPADPDWFPLRSY